MLCVGEKNRGTDVASRAVNERHKIKAKIKAKHSPQFNLVEYNTKTEEATDQNG